MPLNIVVFEASKSVSTKTLLLKHYYRRQGTPPLKRGILWTWLFLQNGRFFSRRP